MMKKTEYSDLVVTVNVPQEQMHMEKQEDFTLPEFTKEVPVSSKKNDNKEERTVEYEWKNSKTEVLRIKKITFRKGEDLDQVYRVAAKDGEDSVTFNHNNTVYILRKTTKEIAQSLYSTYGKMMGVVEHIVGYLRTVLGNDYIISKVEKGSWSFDKRISKEGVNFVDIEKLGAHAKSKLVEKISEKISELHNLNFIIGKFNINNVLLLENDLQIGDLRKLRVSRKKSFVIEEFKSIMQYLFMAGVASREDVYQATAYYCTKNESSAFEWYKEKGGRGKDLFDITTKMEEEIYA
jgi:hypothetical protein